MGIQNSSSLGQLRRVQLSLRGSPTSVSDVAEPTELRIGRDERTRTGWAYGAGPVRGPGHEHPLIASGAPIHAISKHHIAPADIVDTRTDDPGDLD